MSDAKRALYSAAAGLTKPVQRNFPEFLNKLAQYKAIQTAKIFLDDPSFDTVFSLFARAHRLFSFTHRISTPKLSEYHSKLTMAHVKLIRQSRLDKSSLEAYPQDLLFLAEFDPLFLVCEKFGNCLTSSIFNLKQISIAQKQQLFVLIWQMPNFQRNMAKAIYASQFEECIFDDTLRLRAPGRQAFSLSKIASSVRTVYNDLAKNWVGTTKTPWPFGPEKAKSSIESAYVSASRLVQLIACGRIKLQSIIALNTVVLNRNAVSVQTVVQKMINLSRFLDDLVPTLDQTALRTFIETAPKEYSARESEPQSQALPSPMVLDYCQQMDESISPKERIDSANMKLITAIGSRIGRLTALPRLNVRRLNAHTLRVTFLSAKTQRPTEGPQFVDIPTYEHFMSPDRALQTLNTLLGPTTLLLGYCRIAAEIKSENYLPHTPTSIRRLYHEAIKSSPLRLQCVVSLKRVTPNAGRFTAQQIRLRANIRKEVRDEMAQHRTREIRQIYEASEMDMIEAGKKLVQLWFQDGQMNKFHRVLRNQLEDPSKPQPKPMLPKARVASYSRRAKKRKLVFVSFFLNVFSLILPRLVFRVAKFLLSIFLYFFLLERERKRHRRKIRRKARTMKSPRTLLKFSV